MLLLIGWKLLYKVLACSCSIIGAIWTAKEISTGLFPGISILNAVFGDIRTFIYPAVLGGIARMLYLLHCEIFPTYKFDDKIIRVRIGNILKKKKGNIIIGSNEQLKTSAEEIGSQSIHKQLLEKKAGNQAEIEKIFAKYKNSAHSKSGFFQGEVGGKAIIFLVMSTLDQPQIATTTKRKMSQSIRELFSRQSELQIQNSTVFCPLLGTGEAGINLSKDEVITMIIGMFIDSCRQRTHE